MILFRQSEAELKGSNIKEEENLFVLVRKSSLVLPKVTLRRSLFFLFSKTTRIHPAEAQNMQKGKERKKYK